MTDERKSSAMFAFSIHGDKAVSSRLDSVAVKPPNARVSCSTFAAAVYAVASSAAMTSPCRDENRDTNVGRFRFSI